MKKVIAGLAIVIGTSHAAWAVDCSSFPNNTVTGFVNEDVTAFEISCTIARNASVNGNVLQSGNGSLTIRGVVNGGVEETGAGGITLLAGARVNGDLSELDGGNIVIRGGTTLGGGVSEAGAGSVTVAVDSPGLIKGDINESGLGSVFVTTISGDYEGSIIEADAGDVDVSVASGTFFKGGIEEELAGSVVVDVDGRFEGNLVERGAGNLTTAGSGTVAGNSEHEPPGTCSNTLRDFQGAICSLL